MLYSVILPFDGVGDGCQHSCWNSGFFRGVTLLVTDLNSDFSDLEL